ncbi:MAG: hypothetical protein KA479_07925 [Saprospiraceae bacterium]|nr:hypothetical protein [Saprospiraceae bacterium]
MKRPVAPTILKETTACQRVTLRADHSTKTNQLINPGFLPHPEAVKLASL